jgi:hypothetical protein
MPYTCYVVGFGIQPPVGSAQAGPPAKMSPEVTYFIVDDATNAAVISQTTGDYTGGAGATISLPTTKAAIKTAMENAIQSVETNTPSLVFVSLVPGL